MLQRRKSHLFHRLLSLALLLLGLNSGMQAQDLALPKMKWTELPSLPNDLGVAGPFAGVHQDALIVAGGANFPKPVWENDKQWLDDVYILRRSDQQYQWSRAGKLPRRIAYGCSVTIDEGVLCMGGADAEQHFADVFLIRLDEKGTGVVFESFPPLPQACAYGAATISNHVVYFVGGQTDSALQSASQNVWAFDLKKRAKSAEYSWETLAPMPASNRAFHILISSADATDESIFLISGRRQNDQDEVEFLRDTWQYRPRDATWDRCADAPKCLMAGVGVALSSNDLVVLGGADGTLFHRGDELKNRHPGFPKKTYAYDMRLDRWSDYGSIPANHVTTVAVQWNGATVIPSGEIRPRVRSPKIFSGSIQSIAE